MIPIVMGLIVKAATVVRAVQAISSALRPSPKPPASESVPQPEKVLCGRFAPTRDKYRYCGNSPIGRVDPSGLIYSAETSIVYTPHIGFSGLFLETTTTGDSPADVGLHVEVEVDRGSGYHPVNVFSGRDYANSAGPEGRGMSPSRGGIDLGSLPPGSIDDRVLLINNKDLVPHPGEKTRLRVKIFTYIQQCGKLGVSKPITSEFDIGPVITTDPPSRPPQSNN